MMKTLRGPVIGLGAALVCSGIVAASPAQAAGITCNSTITLAGGNGFVANSLLGAGVCVQTIDTLFGNFNFNNAPTIGQIGFNLTNTGSPLQANHGISFGNNYSPGNTYTIDYSILINSGPNLFSSLSSDFTQSTGNSSLTTTISESSTGSVNITKAASTATGPDLLTVSPKVLQLDITNILVDNGADSSILNTVLETGPVAVSEPASVMILGSGLLAIAAIRYRKSF